MQFGANRGDVSSQCLNPVDISGTNQFNVLAAQQQRNDEQTTIRNLRKRMQLMD